ncbi:Zn2 DNA-binding protein [Venustampulla echinocandica]|uniref:Zn2 DNA-binding protein n=1 Tax=Venustampulla echinocandica TaxID=2656787 RepID=A0A370TY46_9HELO|nr:Zn2 DNA-binding protein [Venustampulla echinocandica]RDL40440.1 Zn2 DNA-binding protein [Venustampulla echinocandica]
MTEANTTTKRARRCGTKTRTGCKTCKIRHIKCDEAKPWCQKCTSTGRKCDGYIIPGAEDRGILNSDGKTSAITLPRAVSRLPGNPQERRGFHYFINQTSPELNGFFTTGFWERLVLQASHVEPSLRHTVVAIGALHEEFSQTPTDGRLAQVVGGRLPFAVKQYTKAIGHLRRSLATGDHDPLTALMSCILFVCFDCLRGYYHTAMVHLKSGMKILRDLRAQSKERDPTIENIIAPLLVRLSVQSILYVDTSQPEQRKRFATELRPVILSAETVPEVFDSLDEARASMNECADGLFKTFYISEAHLAATEQSDCTLEHLKRYALMLSQWNVTFEKFMNAKSQSFSSREIRGAALLKVHHIASSIMSTIVPGPEDMRPICQAVNCPTAFVKFSAEFRIIINLCTSLITAVEEDAKNGKPPLTFSTDLGLIAPLYYTAMKPACPMLRQDALALLKRCPRKEGMWDSFVAVKLVTQYWQIEDQERDRREAVMGETGICVPQAKLADLAFFEGNSWEWVWPNTSEITPAALVLNSGGLIENRALDNVEAHKNINAFDEFGAFEGRGLGFDIMESQGDDGLFE